MISQTVQNASCTVTGTALAGLVWKAGHRQGHRTLRLSSRLPNPIYLLVFKIIEIKDSR